MIIDVHTHGVHPHTKGITRITSIRAGIETAACTYPFSYGIHPYDVMIADIDNTLCEIERLQPIVIGEIGMDFRFQKTAARQSLYFRKQIEKAEELRKPVIIHAVRSTAQILSIMSRHPKVRFAIHGFRSGIRQAQEIVNAGGFISVSPNLPKNITDIYEDFGDRLLLETDETQIDIAEHYGRVADILNISIAELEKNLENNFVKWIGNRELSCC